MKFIFTVREKPPVDTERSPATVFINHGSREARLALKEAIQSYQPSEGERQVKAVEFAASEKWYDLDAHCWLEPEPSEDLSLSLVLNDIAVKQRRTNELLKKLVELLSAGLKS